MTSLDKYQIVNIIYLAVCCLWQSINLISNNSDKILNSIAFAFFLLLFFSIQLVFLITLIRLYREIKKKEKEEKDFLIQLVKSEKENLNIENEKENLAKERGKETKIENNSSQNQRIIFKETTV